MSWNEHRVRRLRQTLGVTQNELAKVLGCRQQTVSEWELGLYAPANAYGKLLTMIESQATFGISHTKSSVRERHGGSSHDPQVSDGSSPDFNEFPFDKPFDPAID